MGRGSVYEANVIDALTKRVAFLQARVDEHPAPVEKAAAPPAPEFQVEEPATRLMADTKPAPGQNPELFDEALFAETMGPERS